jgi:hypothetical protein
MRYAVDLRHPVYKPLAVAMIRVEGNDTYISLSRPWECGNPERDFQRVWEVWEAGFMASMLYILCHFHGLIFAGKAG